MIRFSRLSPSVALMVLSLTACASAPDGHDEVAGLDPATAYPIEIQETRERLELAPVAGADLGPGDVADLMAFALEYRQVGRGDIVMEVPVGGAADGAAALRAQAARALLTESGVPASAISGGGYDASGQADAPLVFSFTRYRAQGPRCPAAWQVDYAKQSTVAPYTGFGCAMQANLAAMVVDPGDLIGPRSEDPADMGRRAKVLENYRAGLPTATSKSDDQSGAISQAVR
jgi:pilus assembly protein CpaD